MSDLKTPAILHPRKVSRNFALEYGENIMANRFLPYTSVSSLDALSYNMPIRQLTPDTIQATSPFKILLGLKEDSLNSTINEISKLRAKVIADTQKGIIHGSSYDKYMDAVNKLTDKASALNGKITSYANSLTSSFAGNALADERKLLRDAATKATGKLNSILQEERKLAEKLYSGSNNFEELGTLMEKINGAAHDLHHSFEKLQAADSKLRLVGKAFQKTVKLPWQKSILPAEYYKYTPDFSSITKRVEALASNFGLDAAQLKLSRAILEGADPATLESVDKLIQAGNKNGFLSWLSKEATAMTGVAQDLKNNGVKLAGVSADAATSLAKNIKDKGDVIAGEVSKFAAENKVASSVVDKIKNFLSMKDFKNVFKVCEKEPEAKALLTNSCIKYGGIIGLGAAAVAGLIAYQRKEDRKRQEEKYKLGGMAI